MNGLSYLISRKIKNRIRLVFERPSELIITLIFIALMAFTVFEGNSHTDFEPYYRSTNELYAIMLAVYVFIFIMSVYKSFENGATMFSMADVNLIFTSPKKPKNVLVYGLLSKIGQSVAFAFVLIYQYGLLNQTYGVDLKSMAAILIGYAVTVFCSQMLSMVIYSLTSKSDKRTRIAKGIFYAVVGAFALYFASGVFGKEDMLASAVAMANSRVMHFFPVAGFTRLGAVAFIGGDLRTLLVSLGAFLVFLILYFICVSLINSDYYEDVLKATEVSFSAITSRKEGKVQESAPKNVKVGKTGFKKGFGASAIYEKHKIENRRGKVFFLDTGSLLMAAATIGFCLIMRDALSAFVFNIYIGMFSIGTGRWARELRLPYIYMIPENPTKKLWNTVKEQLPSLLAESVITFLPMMFMAALSPYEAVAFILSKFSFSLVFIGVNLIFQRFLGNAGSKRFIVFIYVLMSMLFCVPYIAFVIVAINVFYIPFVIALLFAPFMNFLMAGICFFFARNILSVAEHNNK